jgi:DnaJ-class molecular chaperone
MCNKLGMDKEEIRRIIRQELAIAIDNEITTCDSCCGLGRKPNGLSTSGEHQCGKCNGTGSIRNKELWGYQKS